LDADGEAKSQDDTAGCELSILNDRPTEPPCGGRDAEARQWAERCTDEPRDSEKASRQYDWEHEPDFLAAQSDVA
jgi:hypothetical protein